MEIGDAARLDLVATVMQRLPVMVICTLLNVPLEDATTIKGWSGRIGKNRGGVIVADLMDAHAAMGEFEFRSGNAAQARTHFMAALAVARNPMERRFLDRRVAECVGATRLESRTVESGK